MAPVHTFRLNGQWEGPATGLVEADNVHTPLAFSAPVEFHGEPGFWTPEHLLLAAVSSCFLTTFHVIAGNSKVEVLDVQAAVEGDVSHEEDGWQFTGIRISVHATIAREQDRERVLRLIDKAERACIISRGLKVSPALTSSVDVYEKTGAEAAANSPDQELAPWSRSRG